MIQIRFIGIDPSTKTGFVALDENGKVLRAKELTGVGSVDPKRMITLIDNVIGHIQKGDFIVIEGFSYHSQGRGISFQFGLGWGIRAALARRGYKYIEATPAAVKKFATGRGNAKKDAMAVPIFKHWGFEHSSDNVRDAYIMAQIAKGIYEYLNGITETKLTKYQVEVINAILNPSSKQKRGRSRK